MVSVSTTFFPSATALSPLPPDLILFSSDAVFFYVHRSQLIAASNNGFNDLLARIPLISKNATSAENASANAILKAEVCDQSTDIDIILSVPEAAPVLNVLLHTVYEISCAQYCPTFEIMSAAVRAMVKYGMSIKKHISPSKPLFSLILSQAPLAPLEAYAIAAEHDLLELAVPISSHLLSCDLSMIDDDLALRVGPIYLRRLFFLHLGRIDALKRLLLPPPHPHPESDGCNFMEQKKLTRAWALAAAYLAWDARPGEFGLGVADVRGCLIGACFLRFSRICVVSGIIR